MKMHIIKTERLILRPWKKEDEEPYAQLNADKRVMEFFPSTLTKDESDQMVARMQKKMEEKGWGLWAVTTLEKDVCIGFIGLNDIDKSILIDQPIEIGWRLAFDAWGRGYATEGAKACLKWGFETLNLDEIVAITAVPNNRSRNVMEKLGMHHDQDRDFDHPKLAIGHPLRRHVLYSLRKNEWRKK